MPQVAWILTQSLYAPLLGFVNQEPEPQSWRTMLQNLGADQLFEVGIEDGSSFVPTIDSRPPTLNSAKSLRAEIRSRMETIAHRRRSTKSYSWRSAKVLATGEIFFADAGDWFRFLVERLEYALEGNQQGRFQLGLCPCGCSHFFLSKGHRERRFLSGAHRMNYHNARNVSKKREFARRKRAEGDERYF